jgi:hypothetical protein
MRKVSSQENSNGHSVRRRVRKKKNTMKEGVK